LLPICLFCLLLMMPPLFARETLLGPVPTTVLRVIDGDSLVVRATIWLGQEVETTVRLLGVDTPELRGACGEERNLATRSRAFTARLADTGAEISLSDIQLGKFAGRVLARVVTAGGVDIGQALIDAGLARPYPPTPSHRKTLSTRIHLKAMPNRYVNGSGAAVPSSTPGLEHLLRFL
jgi:micrococcal nuclease